MLNKNYVLGLVDGEGSFTVYVKNPTTPKAKRRVYAEPRFYLKLNEKDRSVLLELKRFFRCGAVYFQRDQRKNHRDCYRYEVANRKDLSEVIIPFFRQNLPKLPSKRKDFGIFCKMMEAINRGEHLNESGLTRLYLLKKQMH